MSLWTSGNAICRITRFGCLRRSEGKVPSHIRLGGDMIWKAAFRGAITLALFLGLSGCAEINWLGGLVYQLEDNFLFRADTKSHRLLRSYVMLGALVAIGRNVGVPEIDRANFGGSFQQALQYFKDAYDCIYPDKVRPLTGP